jgi:hypothetical protein
MPRLGSVILTFCARRFGHVYGAPGWLLREGRRSSVDRTIGGFGTVKNGRDPFPVFGRGVLGALYPGDDFGVDVYRDAHGVRLLELRGPTDSCDRLIVSRVSRHPARRIALDLAALRTPSGVGIGTSGKSLLSRLGSPTRRYRYRGYDVLWYVTRPRTYRISGDPALHHLVYADAYALRGGRVIEVMLQKWSDERHG